MNGFPNSYAIGMREPICELERLREQQWREAYPEQQPEPLIMAMWDTTAELDVEVEMSLQEV